LALVGPEQVRLEQTGLLRIVFATDWSLSIEPVGRSGPRLGGYRPAEVCQSLVSDPLSLAWRWLLRSTWTYTVRCIKLPGRQTVERILGTAALDGETTTGVSP